nr:M23 family metallopeptidase [Saprospiraceae bacterium]
GEGYISRIAISPGGYGRAIYIDHPDVGYTSVYAHLEKFDAAIEQFVLDRQRDAESFSVDFYLEPHIFPVTKGQKIGIMGNEGHSYGKHLHFEVRDTKSEQPINPMLFGFATEDNVAPNIMSLALHGLDDHFHKNYNKKIPLPAKVNNIIQIPEPIIFPSDRLGVAMSMYDRTTGAANRNGIYSLEMYVDDSLAYHFQMDKFSFDETRNIIAFFDYKAKKEQNQTYTLCYKYPGNELGFLDETGSGIVHLNPDTTSRIKIKVHDWHKNTTTLLFDIKRADSIAMKDEVIKGRVIGLDDEVIISQDDCLVQFEKNSLFRKIDFGFSSSKNNKNQTTYHIHNILEPIKSPIKISIKADTNLVDLKEKAVIIRQGGQNYGGQWEGEYLTTRIKEFGSFYLGYDTIPPSITSINFSKKAGRKSAYQFRLRDNLTVNGATTRDVKYKVWIDDVFVVSPLRKMNNTLTVPIHQLGKGKHTLKIEAWDHSGNKANYEAVFTK